MRDVAKANLSIAKLGQELCSDGKPSHSQETSSDSEEVLQALFTSSVILGSHCSHDVQAMHKLSVYGFLDVLQQWNQPLTDCSMFLNQSSCAFDACTDSVATADRKAGVVISA